MFLLLPNTIEVGGRRVKIRTGVNPRGMCTVNHAIYSNLFLVTGVLPELE
jgi:hypothetical protein